MTASRSVEFSLETLVHHISGIATDLKEIAQRADAPCQFCHGEASTFPTWVEGIWSIQFNVNGNGFHMRDTFAHCMAYVARVISAMSEGLVPSRDRVEIRYLQRLET